VGLGQVITSVSWVGTKKIWVGFQKVTNVELCVGFRRCNSSVNKKQNVNLYIGIELFLDSSRAPGVYT